MVFHADMCMFLPAAIVNIFARRWKNTTTFFLANNTLRWLSFIKNVYNTSKMHNFFFHLLRLHVIYLMIKSESIESKM